MTDTVLVSLPIAADLVDTLGSDALRERLGYLASVLLRAELTSAQDADLALMEAIGRLKVHAHMHGLTDALLAEELLAFNAEWRE